MAQVSPEGPERPVGLKHAQAVGPPLRQQGLEGRTGLRPQERVVLLVVPGPDIGLGWHDVEVACQNHRHAGRHEFCRVGD